MAKRRNTKTLFLALAALAGLALYWYFTRPKTEPEPLPAPLDGQLVVRFLNIGQGDCELIQLPNGQTILIDSGDRGSPTVELLKQFGVREIDLLIATHPHSDHIGEMRDIMRAFKVKELWDAGYPYTTKTYLDLLQERKSQGIQFTKPRRGETRTLGDVRLEALHPTANLPTDDNEVNNVSIVVRLTYGNTRFLFAGDAEVAAWEDMIAHDRDKLRADLLKAAHHGSSNGTSQKVLDAVQPSFVTISCKAGNDYHHPHPKVMSLLKQRSDAIKLFRTDLDGTITAASDGSRITMRAENDVAQDQRYLTGDEVAGRAPRNRDARGTASGRR